MIFIVSLVLLCNVQNCCNEPILFILSGKKLHLIFKKYLFVYLAASDLSCGMCRIFAVLCRLCSRSKQAQLPRVIWDLSSLTRGGNCILCIARWICNYWTTREVPYLIFLKRENTQIGCYDCGQNEKEEAHGAWEGITGKGPAQMNLRKLPGREAPEQTDLETGENLMITTMYNRCRQRKVKVKVTQ